MTLWYRGPDVLLGSRNYTTSIDMWSVGCILAEMVTGKPLFPGKSNDDQLLKIFKILGTPNESTWPRVSEYPSYAGNKWPVMPRRPLTEIVTTLDPQGHDLLAALLSYEPSARPTAKQSLQHPFFSQLF